MTEQITAAAAAASIASILGVGGIFATRSGIDTLAAEMSAAEWSDVLATVNELWRTAFLGAAQADYTRSAVAPDAHFVAD